MPTRARARSRPLRPLAVSACLLGLCTRFDGGCRARESVLALSERFVLVPLCPEQLGGLPTPRPPAEIQDGDGYAVLEGRSSVMTAEGGDVTAAFLRGAGQVLRAAEAVGVREAVLKARSPSCGARETYDGSFTRTLREGPGVTAALLLQNGIRVVDEEHLDGLGRPGRAASPPGASSGGGRPNRRGVS